MLIGLNIGSISVKKIVLDNEGNVISQEIKPHMGQPLEIVKKWSETTNDCHFGVSGHFGHVSESQAIERACSELNGNYDVIISLGGEAFAVYLLSENKVQNVLSHNRCAAGSGEFLVQQLGRLNLSLEEGIELAKQGNSIKLASRCSVHCKSDITHKLNRQEATVEDIVKSVHDMMASKITSLLDKTTHPKNRILIIGGLSRNEVIRTSLEDDLPLSKIEYLELSPFFEAYGTALITKDNPQFNSPKLNIEAKFSTTDPFTHSEDSVKIIPAFQGSISGKLILGIDGGSTTTKATLVNLETKEIIASYYNKTNGNPIKSAKECIEKIISEIGDVSVQQIATTGSAREIIGAFVGTEAVYNEISAHATGALSFDPNVDTIFEIGGQDSKYIYIENGAPVDYTMNAACSAGTGSFLEESAKGDLGLKVTEISNIALTANNPVDFKAECAAFINSDIRAALQEGYGKEDIIAGLVNSIVKNYLGKVKGHRKVGKKVFLQGGVAKNSSVAYSFAQATGKEIIVPPNPELMGAFGVALMAIERMGNGTIPTKTSLLSDILTNDLTILGNFTCKSCENYCTIMRYQVGDRKFPFGGACSKYENRWKRTEKGIDVIDFVEERNKLILNEGQNPATPVATVAIPRALTVHSLFPLYRTFFQNMGYKVILSNIDSEGELYTHAPFCYPTQVAHGAILSLVKNQETSNFDYVFFPHVKRMPYAQSEMKSFLCPITQSSPYVLQKAFPNVKLFTPTLDFQKGYENSNAMIDFAVNSLKIDKELACNAYDQAVKNQRLVESQMYELGQRAILKVKQSKKPAIVLAGRSYNAFPRETSQAIGKKLASKGIIAIPFDCLGPQVNAGTTWHYPNLILESSNLVKEVDNLFLLYISNFGCNIDSFNQEFMREEMGTKPYLKLDIDSHTADAGTITRIEAFLEIISNYSNASKIKSEPFQVARFVQVGDDYQIRKTDGNLVSLEDPNVSLHLPLFSKYHNDVLPLAFRWLGINAPESIELNEDIINEGLRYCSGNECLPLPIALGQILELDRRRKPGEVIGVFMLTGGEPCVVAAYERLVTKFIRDHEIQDLFLFAPHLITNNAYNISKLGIFRNFPLVITVADAMTEMANVVSTCGKTESLDQLERYWQLLLSKGKSRGEFQDAIDEFIENTKMIQLESSPKDHPVVIISGDFYVRFDPFFYRGLRELYSKEGIILKPVDLTELALYPQYDNMFLFGEEINIDPNSRGSTLRAAAACTNQNGRMYMLSWLALKVLERTEKKLRDKFMTSGLLVTPPNEIREIVDLAADHIDPSIYGESILTIGKGVEAMADNFQGILVLGPFACLPFRVSEAILKPLCYEENFPFLSYETDARQIPPTFLRLVDVHIQQVLRVWKRSDRDLFIKLEMSKVS